MAVLIADFEELVRAQILVLFRQLINAIGIFIDFITKTFYCIIEIVEFFLSMNFRNPMAHLLAVRQRSACAIGCDYSSS